MGLIRSARNGLAIGVGLLIGLKALDSMGYTPVIKNGFDVAVNGVSSVLRDVTGIDAKIKADELLDLDEIIRTAENVKTGLPEGYGTADVANSIDSLISLVDNLKSVDIPPEYVDTLKDVLSTSTGALQDMNVGLDDLSFDDAFGLLNNSISNLRNVENDLNIVEYGIGEYSNYGTYYNR